MNVATELRLKLLASGITPLPSTRSKEVFLLGWTTKSVDEAEVRSWESNPDWPSSSCRTTDHPCLDIDIKDEAAASACEQLVRDRFDGQGALLVRFGLAPKRLIPFCTAAPFPKRVMCYAAPNGERHKIEFLGDGQQAVFYGYHEGAQRDYRWHADRDPLKVPPREWVSITEVEADELLTEIDELLTEQFGYERVLQTAPTAALVCPHPGGTDYSENLLSAASGADVNSAQSKRILSLLNRGEHPDDVEQIVGSETLSAKAWDARTWTEKKEVAFIRRRIRSALRKLNSEYRPDVATIPGWLHEAFHVEWCRIAAFGGHPALTRSGHTCMVVDTKPTPAGANVRAIPLTMSEWLARKFPPRDELMGACFTTTSRSLLSADTGLGKTSLVLAIKIGMAAGRDFLHWKCHRPSWVLFIDGEMSGEWLQVMLQDAQRRIGIITDNLCCLSGEDYPGMPPLNTKEGFAFLRGYIEEHGPFDFISFDNIISLSIGNPKDPEAWQAMLELIAWLSRSRVGQLWVNHTGHDTTRGYGDKAKGWRMTSIIHMDKIEHPGTDVSFELKFEKARERNPSNRADFQPVKIALVRDKWT